MPSVFARPNKFNLSHTNILTCDMGKLIPFLTQEVLPGDEFRIKTDAMVRLAPMLAPIFGEVDFYTHYFFVPNRLLWDNWEKFITHGLESGTDSSVKPYFYLASNEDLNAYSVPGSLLDYLDYPVKDSAGSNGGTVCSMWHVRFDAMPVLAYNKIVNDWYLNEYLQTPRNMQTTDGQHTTANNDFTLASRCWPRDYTTSALPFTQLGSPVTIGIGATAPIKFNEPTKAEIAANPTLTYRSLDYTGTPTFNVENVATADNKGWLGTSDSADDKLVIDNSKYLFADLSQASAVTINDLRAAFQLQRNLERKAHSGNRYVEYLASSFGVRSPDARLQRAEFLGGGKSPIMISEVLQTSAATQSSPQGNMSGHGFGASRSFSVNKAFTEHGYIMGILSIMPKASYFQGRRREHCRWSWTDYYQPEFAHLGEQPIFKSELVCNSTTVPADFGNGDVFGYQPRYEEYRRKLNGVHGDFRTNMAYWHLARIFSSVPSLNSDFVACNPSKRIFAAGEQADRPCWVEMFLDIKAIRPLPKKGTPGYIDH